MVLACNCCKTLFRASADLKVAVGCCERCEAAYLEFKLGLLIVAYRQVTRKADEF